MVVSIKVHCLISCFCEIIKRRSKADFRPYYFGVWDSSFQIVDKMHITYFADDIKFSFYREWYEKFFGLHVHEWYDSSLSRESNINQLLDLLETKPEERYIIVHLDMSLIPERENKFNQKPFPHFLMISKTEKEDEWFMFDPDFRWEGNVKKEHVINAIRNNLYGGGFYIDAKNVKAPTYEVITTFFYQTFKREENELTSMVKDIVEQVVEEKEGFAISDLMPAFKQLNILAIRKYSYDYALLYFRDFLDLSEENYEYWAQQIRDLVQGYETVRYLAVKASMTGKREVLSQLLKQTEKIDVIERGLKIEIERQFLLWREVTSQSHLTQTPDLVYEQ
ncbi:DUF6005 family protein [Metabacillus fastidiosus]|uniref:DUF6005 family protein n=1 Tax=Metabacillus fastidiosus TaxID=1458 RepID=UPI003D2872C6